MLQRSAKHPACWQAEVCSTNAPDRTSPVVTTIYTSAAARKRSPAGRNALRPRQDTDCTITSTVTEYYTTGIEGSTSKTRTITEYPTTVEESTTLTFTGGSAYVFATGTSTVSAPCGATTVVNNATTSTVTQAAQCAPSALGSEYFGDGVNYLTFSYAFPEAWYDTTASDASSCCQLCADLGNCATSGWDIRTNKCRLQFGIDGDTAQPVCGGLGLYAFVDAGPDHPLPAGAGYYVGALCGTYDYFTEPPDDGT